MRFLLLSLALFYAAIPPGLCACQLQSAFLNSVLSLKDPSGDPAQDDDDDAPGECHCVGTKQLCHTTPTPQVDTADGTHALAADAAPAMAPAAPVAAYVLANPAHRAEAPLYLTLRALRI